MGDALTFETSTLVSEERLTDYSLDVDSGPKEGDRRESAVPAAIALIRDLVNTIDVEGGSDELAAPGGDSAAAALRAQAWLGQRSLWPAGGRALTRAEYEDLLAFRGGLRGLLHGNRERQNHAAELGALNSALALAPVRVVLQQGGEGAQLEPAQQGMAGVIATFAAAIYDSMAEGSWPRLKLCAASSCQWAFYDGSRNRTGTWCSMAVCGNRAKVRTYQARQRARNTAGIG